MSSRKSSFLMSTAVAAVLASLTTAFPLFARPPAVPAASYGNLPLSFEANRGQTDRQVRFTARGRDYSLFLTSTEAVLSLKSNDLSAVVRMKLDGARRNPAITGLEELPGVSNYFIGGPERWRRDVPSYARVKYAGVYPGIDLVYYGNQRQIEYDFEVAPGADPERIILTFAGARNVSVDRLGSLVVTTKAGDLVQQRPFVYQDIDGKRVSVETHYRLLPNYKVGFQIARYDTTRALVIDPVLVYATYLGGSGNDIGQAIAIDAAGNTYVTGSTISTNFPGASTSAIQAVPNGNEDVFVAKLNPAGNALVYSTYLGGSGGDFGFAIAVDGSGNAYITGQTSSPTTIQMGFIPFPRVGAIQSSYKGGGDTFFTKLNAAGDAIVYSTYYGGTGVERGHGVAVDSAGLAYFSGSTNSLNFPTVSPFQGINGGSDDGYVVKLNAAGSAPVYSTYLGGNGSEYSQEGGGIVIDESGNAYVVGTTSSTNFPGAATFTDIQPTYGGGFNDAFYVKLNATGSALLNSTYLGGSGYDSAYGIALGLDGSTYVTGYTDSTNFPTGNALQPSRNGVANDAFVVKIAPAGNGILYSTYLGGSGAETAYDITVDAGGRAYISGTTSSTDFPMASPIQAFPSGATEMFVSKLGSNGSVLQFSTYLGGSTGFEHGRGIKVDTAGNVYVTGSTNSTNFPTVAAFQAGYGGGGSDALVVKIAVGLEPGVPLGVSADAQSTSNVMVTWNAVAGATSYEVYRGCKGALPFMSSTTSTSLNDINASPNSAYVYWVRAVNSAGSSENSRADLATTVMFTDDPLVAFTTIVKAAHIQELRSAVNAVRVCAALNTIGYIDSLGPGTIIQASHIEDLHVAMNEARFQLNLPYAGYGSPVVAGETIRASKFTMVRTAMK